MRTQGTSESEATLEPSASPTTDSCQLIPNDSCPSNVSSNTTETVSYFLRDEQLAKAEIGLLSAILFLALFGNLFVLGMLRLRRQPLTRMQWFIVHLSVADVFVAVFHVLPQLLMDITNQFYGDDFLCRSLKYLSVVAMYASSYVMLMAAVDRYVSICHPLTNRTLSPKRVHLMILVAWSLSLLFSLPQVSIFSLQQMTGGGYECYAEFQPVWGLKAYVTWVFVSVYALPFLLLTFCYTRICWVVWGSVTSRQHSGTWGSRSGSSRRERTSSSRGFMWRISFSKPSGGPSSGEDGKCAASRLHASDVNGHAAREDAQSLRCLTSGQGKPRGHRRGVSKSKVKTVKLTLAVVLCYLFCWAPFFIANMLTVWDQTIAFEGPVMTVIALLASLNSCTNPWIYLVFSGRAWPLCGAHAEGSRRSGTSRSWTRSTHVITDSEAPSRSHASLYEMSVHGPASPTKVKSWTRDPFLKASKVKTSA